MTMLVSHQYTARVLKAVEGEPAQIVTFVLSEMIFYAVATRASSRQVALKFFNELLEVWILQVSTDWDHDSVVAARDEARRAK